MKVHRIDGVTRQSQIIAVEADHASAGPVAVVLEIRPSTVIGLDIAGIAALRAALDKAEAAYHARMGTNAPPTDMDVAKALLKRTIPALNMAIMLADTTAHQTSREQLRNEVAALLGPFNPYENSDMHYTPDAWVSASAHSRQQPELEVIVKQGREIIGKAFQYPDPPMPGPGMRDTVFHKPGAIVLDIGQKPDPPIPAQSLAEAEKLVRAGYVFSERAPNRIECERDSSLPSYMLTQEQARIFYAATVNVSQETQGKAPVYVGATPLSLGRRINAARRSAGLNGMQVADHLGIGLVLFERYERDADVPSDERLEKLAALFGVSVEELKG